MELVYLYIESLNGVIKNQEINFSTDFSVKYLKGDLIVHHQDTPLPQNFWSKKIISTNLIIGKNGVGKSSILNLIGLSSRDRKTVAKNSRFFLLYHLYGDAFYISGTPAILEKILDTRPRSEDALLKINRNGIQLLNKKYSNFDKTDIFYLKRQNRATWYEGISLREERKGLLYKNPNIESAPSDILQYLTNEAIFKESKNIKLILKQRGIFKSHDAELLKLLYHGDSSDYNLSQGIIKIESKQLDKKLDPNGYSGDPYFRKNLDAEYREISNTMMYFIYNLCEKKVINLIEKSMTKVEDPELKLPILDRIFLLRRMHQEYFDIPHLLDLGNRVTFLVHIIEDLEESHFEPEKSNFSDVIKMLDTLTEAPERFSISKNTIEFSLFDLGQNDIHRLSAFVNTDQDFIKITYKNLSDGEIAYIDIFSSLLNCLDNSKNVLLLLDEPDIYMHPEWSRCFVDKLLNLVDSSTSQRVQIIITTHSPFMLTDFPSFCVHRLENHTGRTVISSAPTSYAANFYDLLSDSFFMDFPFGEFTRQKLENLSQNNRENINKTISFVDDPMLKTMLLDTYDINPKKTGENRYD